MFTNYCFVTGFLSKEGIQDKRAIVILVQYQFLRSLYFKWKKSSQLHFIINNFKIANIFMSFNSLSWIWPVLIQNFKNLLSNVFYGHPTPAKKIVIVEKSNLGHFSFYSWSFPNFLSNKFEVCSKYSKKNPKIFLNFEYLLN